jgi:hypothetical protein
MLACFHGSFLKQKPYFMGQGISSDPPEYRDDYVELEGLRQAFATAGLCNSQRSGAPEYVGFLRCLADPQGRPRLVITGAPISADFLH